MTVTLDKFGRVLIPKRVRDVLGLRPGDEMTLSVRSEGPGPSALELTPEGESPLVVRESMLVHEGRLEEKTDIVDIIRRERADRSRAGARGIAGAGFGGSGNG